MPYNSRERAAARARFVRQRCVIAALIGAATPAMAAPPPRFTASEVEYKLTAETRIGAKRSGLLCMPAGKLLWKEAAPAAGALKAIIAAEAHAAGLDIMIPSDDDFSDAVRTPYRITVTVERVMMNACFPWQGIRVGKQARLAAAGSSGVVWRIFDQRRRVLALKVLICGNVDRTDGTGDLREVTARHIALGGLEVSRIIAENSGRLAVSENRPTVLGQGCAPARPKRVVGSWVR